MNPRDHISFLSSCLLPHESGFTPVGEPISPRKSQSAKDFLYDANGNLIRDLHRGIVSINYAPGNKPIETVYTDDSNICWIYSASGEKLAESTQSIDGSFDRFRYWTGGWEYLDGHPDRLVLDQGYVDTLANLHLFIPDCQGNIMGVFNTSDGTIEQFTDYYPYGMPHLDATNHEINRRKYSGKELPTDLGLDEYDFDARRRMLYNPIFSQTDPLAGALTHPETGKPLGMPYLSSFSPYSYCAGDPINLIDPTGMAIIYDENGNYLGMTKEGFTGDVLIYSGNEKIKFSNYTAKDLTTNTEFSKVITPLSSSITLGEMAICKIINHVVSHFNGFNFYGYRFSTSSLIDNKIHFDGGVDYKANWQTNFYKSTRFRTYIAFSVLPEEYEMTVENIACSIIIHEWLGHGKLKYHDSKYNHWLCYQLVMQDKLLYPGTTSAFKKSNYLKYNKYIKKSLWDPIFE